jgi:hypothetical protein
MSTQGRCAKENVLDEMHSAEMPYTHWPFAILSKSVSMSAAHQRCISW